MGHSPDRLTRKELGAMKILLIDNNEQTRKDLEVAVESDGYDFFATSEGGEGLEIFTRELPDIVFVDMGLTDIDGIELVKKIKEQNPDVQVVVTSESYELDLAIQALQCDVTDLVKKPIRKEALAAALRLSEERLWKSNKLKAYVENLEGLIKDTTEELQKRHELEHNLIQTSMDGIIANDRKGNIIIFNEGAERIYGYTSDEALSGMSVTKLYPKGEARRIKKLTYSDDYGGSGRLVNYEAKALTKKGELVPILLSATLLYEEGQEVAMVGYFKDMRQIKRLEAELIESERMAAMGRATAGIAHGVKNILHGMKLGAFMVDKGLEKEKGDLLRKGWNLVGKNINRISRMTLDMLSYARSSPPVRQRCSLNDIVNEVCELMEEKAIRRQIELIWDLDPSVPLVEVDAEGIHSCLLNLVTNAIEAFPETSTGGQITVSSRDEAETGVILQVKDTGRDMTKELQEQVFEHLYSTKGARGTGLGLAITQKIVREHGGTIQLESEPKKGSCFTILLPK
jgi:PAS domain S-box-containing protein